MKRFGATIFAAVSLVWAIDISQHSDSSPQVDFVNCLPNGTLCERVICAPLLECSGRVVQNGSRCKCCPVCVKLLDENEKCSMEEVDENGPVHTSRCKSGLQCKAEKCIRNDDLTSKCQKMGLARQKPEDLPFPFEFPARKDLWIPDCDLDGNFEIKQCPDTRCFCVDKFTGGRIHGQEEAELATNMTCACSHALNTRKKELKEKGRDPEWQTYEQEHCTTSGNYEDLQCYRDTCFCADPQTGHAKGTMVKIKQRDQLPCYDSKVHKESYSTICEAQLITERRTIYEFSQKNLKIIGLITIDCDPDGSFIQKLCRPEICYCSDRDGTSFGVYKKDRAKSDDDIMECRCARDEEDNLYHHSRYEKFKCDGVGNYNIFQCFDEKCFCLDDNGYRITEINDIERNMTEICELARTALPYLRPELQT